MPRILVVEDNEMNRDLLVRRLQRKGFEVISAADGAEGIARASSDHPDVVLMDMSLPVMDGWEATKALKADERTRSIPVIALTAHAMADDRERALEAGCDEYDTKPIDFSRLMLKINLFLPQEEKVG
ncbi:MAG: response regulator [Alphaproteobacteria bacterium]